MAKQQERGWPYGVSVEDFPESARLKAEEWERYPSTGPVTDPPEEHLRLRELAARLGWGRSLRELWEIVRDLV